MRFGAGIILFLLGGFLTAQPITSQPDSVYVPAPVLSPSLDTLWFENILPGQSQTLFIDLANLGEGRIDFKKSWSAAQSVRPGLRGGTLFPGQFIRFPVTLTQPDMRPIHEQLTIAWYSSRFDLHDTLEIAIISVPEPPLQINPRLVRFVAALAGVTNQVPVTLMNRSNFTIRLGAIQAPPGIQIYHQPLIVPPNGITQIDILWLPGENLLLHDTLRVDYRMGESTEKLLLPLTGNAIVPVRFRPGNIDFGKVYAGSAYRRQLLVTNQARHAAKLIREMPAAKSDTGYVASFADWHNLPDEIFLAGGERKSIPVTVRTAIAGMLTDSVQYRVQYLRTRTVDIPSAGVQIEANSTQPVEIPAESIQFGDQPVLIAQQQSFVVINHGGSPIALTVYLQGSSPELYIPALDYTVTPGSRLGIPVYYRPTRMAPVNDTLVVTYETFGQINTVKLAITGNGVDRPLKRIGSIDDVVLDEDFPGPVMLANLSAIFIDPNNRIFYRIEHTLGAAMKFEVDESARLMGKSSANFHGSGSVVVVAANSLAETVSDTFQIRILSVNDLPQLADPIHDLVLHEDSPALMLGRLSEIFTDPDRYLDTVRTSYRVFTPVSNKGIRLVIEGDELRLTVSPDWWGQQHFVLTARDEADTSALVYNSFHITVLPVNDPPDIGKFPDFELPEDESVSFRVREIIGDIDDPLDSLTLSIMAAAGPPPATVQFFPGGTMRIAPHPDWWGTARIRVIVTDPQGASDTAGFQLTVLPVDDPPAPFSLIGPLHTDWEQRFRFFGPDTLLEFSWNHSLNKDKQDRIYYTWQLMDTSYHILDERPAGGSNVISVDFDSSGVYLWRVIARDENNNIAQSDTYIFLVESLRQTADDRPGELPLSIGPNSPNPFGSRTAISYTIPRYTQTTITIYDAMGRQVALLLQAPRYRGSYSIQWDSRDDRGQLVASGPYVAELRTNEASAYMKLVVLR